MTRFIDGPAAGVTLMLRRAPHFLRAVHDGKDWDALDQLEDRPAASEIVVAYEMVGEPTWMHIRARKGGGIYRGGSYQVVKDQPADEVLRNQAAWEAWAVEHFEPHAPWPAK